MSFKDFSFERLCSLENRLISAVALGDIHEALALLNQFPVISQEDVSHETLTVAKNYCIAINALLRKAVENFQVDTAVIKELSTELIRQVDGITQISNSRDMLEQIVSSYCNLSHNYNHSPYSTPVRNAIIKIKSDIKSDISLKALAESNNISAGYFSALFKKETGLTVTDYANRQRIHRAEALLKNTPLHIKDIALQCGIADVNYFIKLFKKYNGCPPHLYRENNSHTE